MLRAPTSDIRQRVAGAASAAGAHACSEAVERAIAELGRPAELVLIFPTGELDPAAAASEAEAAAAGARVAGMTGTGAIAADGPVKSGCSAIAFSSAFSTGVGAAAGEPRASGRAAAAQALAAIDGAAPYRIVLLFVDSESGDQAEVVAGVYSVAGGRVPLAGGAAGGPVRARFTDGSALSDGVVAVAIGSSTPIGVGVAHGCVPRGAPSIVTRSSGPNLIQLDGRPAQDVYLEKLAVDGESLTDDEFDALAMVHPLAEPELSGAVRPRYVRARGPDGSLVVATHVEQNAAIEICDQTPDAIVQSARTAAEGAVAQLDGPVDAAVVFDCAGRSAWFGGGLAEREFESLTTGFSGLLPSLAGVCTRGEIGRVRGAKGDRNHSVVVAAFSAPD
jgi:hypothetical protein